jgi:hypothetical protein
MRGKLAVVIALLVAAPAAADEPHRDITLDPGKTLMEVKVPGNLYDQLYADYDFVEALQRNGDGSISTDVLVNDAERAALRARGVRFVKTLETPATTERRVAERDAALTRESRARELAQRGAAAVSPRGANNAIPLPGEVTIMRAYTFTNYAGRFLYVEAHTKAATPVTPNNVEGSRRWRSASPAPTASSARPRTCRSTATRRPASPTTTSTCTTGIWCA